MPTPQRVALITGSGRQRVGHVIAKALAEDGFAIAMHYHQSRDEATTAAQALRDKGCRCELFQANVAEEEEVDRLFDAVEGRFGRLDVLVTAAATWEAVALEEVRAADLCRDFSVNTLGTFLCARRAGLRMADQEEGGAIVTLGDWAIKRPYLDHAAYFISKGTIPTLTRTLAVELAHRNPKVRVNCIHPGPVMFPSDCGPRERQELIESTLVKSGDSPQVIADAVRFLAHNEFVTGTCLTVDGGRSIFAGESMQRKRPI